MVDLVSLSLLPITLIERVLLHLEIQDIIHVGQTSSLFKDIALSELLWLRLLEQRWGNLTKPAEWRTDSPSGCFELPNCRLKYPGTYRCSMNWSMAIYHADAEVLFLKDSSQECLQGVVPFAQVKLPFFQSMELQSNGLTKLDLSGVGSYPCLMHPAGSMRRWWVSG